MGDLTGNWNGFYTYDTEDGHEFKTRFKMTIRDTDGELFGESVDLEEDGGNPDSASIKGFYKGNLISLIKVYPFYWFLNEDGLIERILDKKHPEIHYSGRYRDNKFVGTWEMELESWNQGNGFISESIGGKWEMIRT